VDLNQLRSQAFDLARDINQVWQQTRRTSPGAAQQLGQLSALLDKLEPLMSQHTEMGQQFVQGTPPSQPAPQPDGGTAGKISPDAKPIAAWVSGNCKFAQATPPGQPHEVPSDYFARMHADMAERKKQEALKQEQARQQWLQQNGHGPQYQKPAPFDWSKWKRGDPRPPNTQETTMTISAEYDPMYAGEQGEQAYLASGNDTGEIDVRVIYEMEYEPGGGDGWNEPRYEGGHMAYIHNVITQDGRDITGYLETHGLIESLSDQLAKDADEGDSFASSGGRFNFAKKKKKKHSTCGGCGGWVGHWMTACPDCGKETIGAPDPGSVGNGGAGSPSTPTA
jgi:hypothetical protein